MGYPNYPVGTVPVVRIVETDDREITVFVNNEAVASANYDEHGWDGIKAVADTAKAVGLACGADVKED